jgi:hypothetical protein
MTKAKFILIDYENVHTFSPADLSVLKGDEFAVKLFLGVHNKEISVDLVDALLPIGSRVILVRLKAAGANALDLLIAFYIGRLWQDAPASTFYIVSRDRDFDPLIKNLKAIGVDVHRRSCVADVVRDVPAATPTMSDLVAAAATALCKNPHRPSTLKKLRNLLNVRKELSEEQTLELIAALASSGLVQIVGNKVTYNLDAQASSGSTEQP